MDFFIAHTLLCNLFKKLNDCRATNFCVKNVKPSHFHEATDIGNICFMLERKSFSDLQSSEVFDDIYCLTRKLKTFVLSYYTLNRFICA